MMDKPTSTAQHYDIRLKGHIDARWGDLFEGMTITLEESGNTLLSGPVADQAALHGLLKKVRDLGLPLLSVNQVPPLEPTNQPNKEKEMNTNENTPRFTNLSLRTAAIIAGVGLLLMAILSPIAYLNTFQSLVKFDDPVLTAQNILNSMGAFRTCVILLFTVAILDIVVAWALYILLVPTNKNLSALTAWLRVIYAGIFIFAISKLYAALQVITADGTQAMSFLKAFQSIWDMALILFGFHLLVLGYLAFKSGYIPKWLGAFLVLASVGYIADGFGKSISPNYNLNIAQFTFVGEVLLIFWLLWRGFKGFDHALEARK